MDNWIDREHRLRLRAERVAELIRQLWGDRPPPGPDPQMSVLLDALAGDDENGRRDHTVVHGDGLTYHRLALALSSTRADVHALAHLPPALRDRLFALGELDTAPASSAMVALPGTDAGAWDYDAITGLLSFDAQTARLMGLPPEAGQVDLNTRQPAPMHPEDRPLVAAALQESLSTGRPYETRFRCLMPDGTYAWRASRARALNPLDPATAPAGLTPPAHDPRLPRTRGSAGSAPPGTTVTRTRWARLVGFIAADE